MPPFDYERAAELLAELFSEAEAAHLRGRPLEVGAELENAAEVLFQSRTQSYREVLLGCGLARLVDGSINIRHPYMSQGANAFNGRTLDERVVNPFLRDRRIPSSSGPYLAVFRRSVELRPEIASGLRDKAGYAGMMRWTDALEGADPTRARRLVLHILYRFLVLREAAAVPLSKISRLSLEQFECLIEGLLRTPSGGMLPVLLVVAMLRTIKECYALKWEIDFQGINVADKASGVGGDVTIRIGGKILLAAEVTERPIDKARVVSTFHTKILEGGIEDYLFIYSHAAPEDDARHAARQYFSQGHEIGFLQVRDWIVNNLGTLGTKCRTAFTGEILRLLDAPNVPAALKVAWNDIVRNVVRG